MSKCCELLALVLILIFIQNTSQTSRIYRRSTSQANKKFQCGVTSARMGTDLITDGYRAKLGEWPWHGALYHRKNRDSIDYKCGATLIDESYALTAAHCVVNRNTGYEMSKQALLVVFGNVQLFGHSRYSQKHYILEIILHPEFDHDGSKHDIAILSLRSTVKFDHYVVPICLPGFDSDARIHDISGRLGFVVGFGLTEDESTDYSSDLKQAEMPVVEHAECQESNPDLYAQLIYPGMFCAGFRNGTSVCNGDSGGGMYFFDGNKWILRGITAFSGMRQAGSNKCDVQNFAGFMNVRYYLPWIRKIVFAENEIGLGLWPIPSEDSGYKSICFLVNTKYTQCPFYNQWTDALDSLLEDYRKPSVIYLRRPPDFPEIYNCDYTQPPPPNTVCDVDISQYGPCTRENHYNYHKSAPCIFLKLDKIYGWVPQFFNNSANLPSKMPKELQEYIKEVDKKEHHTMNTIWVSCEGVNPADIENIGPIKYYPRRGFPGYYYPYENSDGYLSPLVAVHFESPFVGIVINIECKAWARNIKHDIFDQFGSVQFELLID